MNDLRIGHGFDVHALAEGRSLRLGGVTIPYEKGCVAHSDGDAVLHALCDAMLGGAAMGDIGLHFPDNTSEWENADSRVILRKTAEIIAVDGWHIVNLDCTVMLQAPKIRPYIDLMRQQIASVLGLDVSVVSVKATTTERLGFTGRGEGVAAEAVVLLAR